MVGPSSHRPASRRRHARAGPGADRGRGRGHGPGIHGEAASAGAMDRARHRTWIPDSCGRTKAGDGRPDDRSHAGPADRLCERRGPADGACVRAAPRGRGTAVAGSQPDEDHPAVSRRGRAAVPHRHARRLAGCQLDSPGGAFVRFVRSADVVAGAECLDGRLRRAADGGGDDRHGTDPGPAGRACRDAARPDAIGGAACRTPARGPGRHRGRRVAGTGAAERVAPPQRRPRKHDRPGHAD